MRNLLTPITLGILLFSTNAAYAQVQEDFMMYLSREIALTTPNCMMQATAEAQSQGIEDPISDGNTDRWIQRCAFANACPKAVTEYNSPEVTEDYCTETLNNME